MNRACNTESLAIFCVASMGEVVSACACLPYSGANRNVMLVNLGYSGEMDKVQSAIASTTENFDWDRIEYMYDETIDRLNQGFLQRFILFLQQESARADRIQKMLERLVVWDGTRIPGKNISLFFTVCHNYVLHLAGILHQARRVLFPHGLDQPRKQQILQYPFYYRKRGVVTLFSSLPKQWHGFIKKMWFVKLYLLMMKRRRFPFPFSGVDCVLKFNDIKVPVVSQLIPNDDLRAVLSKIAHSSHLHSLLGNAFKHLQAASTCVLLLSEYEEWKYWNHNKHKIDAWRHVITSIIARENISDFVVKPHPRANMENYRETLSELKKALPSHRFHEWPEELWSVLIEVVLARFPFRVTASIASCSCPPWAGPVGHRNYVSSKAGKLIDEGWVYPFKISSEQGANILRQEGIAIDIDIDLAL